MNSERERGGRGGGVHRGVIKVKLGGKCDRCGGLCQREKARVGLSDMSTPP